MVEDAAKPVVAWLRERERERERDGFVLEKREKKNKIRETNFGISTILCQ